MLGPPTTQVEARQEPVVSATAGIQEEVTVLARTPLI
jgi:hypothetical protein